MVALTWWLGPFVTVCHAGCQGSISSQVWEVAIGRMVNGSTHGVLIYRHRDGVKEGEWHLGLPSEAVFGSSDPQTVLLREPVATGTQ